MNKFTEYLKSKELNSEDIKRILKDAVSLSFTKGDLLLNENQTEEYVYFIEQGCCRFYTVRESDMEEITFQFGFPKEFVNSFLSLKTGTPSEFSIEAITSMHVLAIHKSRLKNLIDSSSNIQSLFRDIIEDLFIMQLKREMHMLKYSVEEQYLFIAKHHPDMLQEIPLKYIASYLGITPQSLCRVRNRIHQKRKS